MTAHAHYSTIRKSGETYYLAGHIGIPKGEFNAPKGIVAQVKAVVENLSLTLAEEHLTLDDIVKVTVYLTNMDNFKLFNDEYATYFVKNKPARSTVGVKELPRIGDEPILVEIDAVAVKG